MRPHRRLWFWVWLGLIFWVAAAGCSDPVEPEVEWMCYVVPNEVTNGADSLEFCVGYTVP